MAIFTVIVAAIFTVIYTGRIYWRVGTSQLDIQQQARQALAFMEKELRQSRPGTGRVHGEIVPIIPNLPADDRLDHYQVTFHIPFDSNGDGTVLSSGTGIVEIVDWSNPITYYLDNKKIIRSLSTDGTSTRVLANNINSLQFIRQSSAPEIIDIIIGGNKTIPGTRDVISFTLRGRVILKN